MLIEKSQRAMYTAGFITVHATSDQHARQTRLPGAGLHSHQGEVFARVGHIAIGDDFKPLRHASDHGQHVICITALAPLPGTPLGEFCRAPRLTRGADGVSCQAGQNAPYTMFLKMCR